ncbi:MAG TPA: SPOR domain-containing protein [bacterium]|nr:SPOR domain-containing protein [bacterium]
MSEKIHPGKDGISAAGIAIALAVFVVVAMGLTRLSDRAVTAPAEMTAAHQTLPREHVEQAQVAAAPETGEIMPPAQAETERQIVAAAEPRREPAQPRPAPPQPAVRPTPAQSEKTSVTINRVQQAARPVPSELLPNVTVPAPGKLVEPPPAVEKVDPKSINDPAAAMWYSVRVGYTDSKVRADILRDVLREQGFPKADTVNGGDGTYFVSLGDFNYRYQAEQVSDSVKDRTSLLPMIHEKTVAK